MSVVPARPRVVVAMDTDASSDPPLGIVQYLWRDVAPELLGLFVEDERLIAHAESRLAREIVFAGRERALDTAALMRHWRARAAEARRRFETLARDLGLIHGFEVRRGDVVAEVLEAAAGAAALIVGMGAGGGAAPPWQRDSLERIAAAPVPAVLFAHAGWSTGRGIVTVVDRHESVQSALRVAVQLAATSHSPLSLLIEAGAAAERESLTAQAAESATAAGVALGSILRTRTLSAETILLAARGARLLVLQQEHTPDASRQATLIARARTPLLLLGASAHAELGLLATERRESARL